MFREERVGWGGGVGVGGWGGMTMDGVGWVEGWVGRGRRKNPHTLTRFSAECATASEPGL